MKDLQKYSNFSSLVFLFMMILLINNLFAQEKIGNRVIKKGIWNERLAEYIDGQIAVKIKQGIKSEDIMPLFNLWQATLVDTFDILRWGLIELPDGTDIFPIVNVLKNNDLIEHVEPNLVVRTHFEPNDPYYTDGHQWPLKNYGQAGGTNDADIDAPEAWNITQGNSNIIIAILDSGIPMLNGTLSHPDLDDPNKFILGPDFTNDGEGVRDSLGHGTHVTGIVSAETNNNTGITGVAGGCRILVVQVVNSTGTSLFSWFKNGVIYACTSGAKIINYSSGDLNYSSFAEDAVEFAYNHGVIICASVGNKCSGEVEYPARFSSYGTHSGHTNGYSNVIAVSATDHQDIFSEYSNKGTEVSVSAPGGHGKDEFCEDGSIDFDANDIFSTTPNYPFNGPPGITQEFGYGWGTSMASPHVAGVAALVLSINQSLNPQQVRDIIEQTAEDKGALGKDDYYGWGRVNAYQAVLLAMA